MALIGAQIQMMLPDLNTGLPQVRAGKIRPLAVFTKTRCPEMPTVPTLNETVMPGFELLPWCGLSGPADLPPAIVATLAKAVHASLDDPQVRKRFASSGVEVFGAGPQEFQVYVQAQLANWTALIHETGIPPQ
jgi:tripartite-type tricarboxylate transporter receptor subunit TctC